ncbi:MAG: hypothetical protein ABIQ44_01375, partial [Chloroflexia bacterium]
RVLHKEYRARKIWQSFRAPNKGANEHHTNRHRSFKSAARDIAYMLYNITSLPFARRKLNSMAASSGKTLGMLPQIMSPEAAANPTPQQD